MKRLELLDYSRFIAAIFVILFHYFFNGIVNGKISSISQISELVDFVKYGYLGVEFFFMISGYVIFFSANRKSAGDFLTSRALRLFPAFWVAVMFTSVVALFIQNSLMSVSPAQFLANLTMFPHVFGYDFVDGVYWTLQYEWKFYFAVFALLTMGLQDRLNIIFFSWPFFILAAKLTGLTWLPYSNDYYCYFAAGCLFAMYNDKRNHILLIPLATCLYLCMSFSIEKSYISEIKRGVTYSSWIIAAAIASFFAIFAFINTTAGANLKLPGSRLAGGLTYPIYLIHAYFGYMVLTRFANEQNKFVVYFICIAIVMVVAYLIHICVEKKMAKVWEQLFSKTLGSIGDFLQTHISAFTNQIYRYAVAKLDNP